VSSLLHLVVSIIGARHIFALILMASTIIIYISFSDLSTVFAQTSPTQSQATTGPFVSYHNPKYPFTLQYPQNWKVKEDQNYVWFISPVGESGGFRIEHRPAHNQTLSILVELQLNQLGASFKDFKIIRSNLTTLAGIPANFTAYSFNMEQQNFFTTNTYKFIGIQISALKGNSLSTIVYFSSPETFDIYLPTVKKMIGTFRIT
jgi:hypothetical protein